MGKWVNQHVSCALCAGGHVLGFWTKESGLAQIEQRFESHARDGGKVYCATRSFGTYMDHDAQLAAAKCCFCPMLQQQAMAAMRDEHAFQNQHEQTHSKFCLTGHTQAQALRHLPDQVTKCARVIMEAR